MNYWICPRYTATDEVIGWVFFTAAQIARHLHEEMAEDDHILFYLTGVRTVIGLAVVAGSPLEEVTERRLRWRSGKEFPLRRRVDLQVVLPPNLRDQGVPYADVKRVLSWNPRFGPRRLSDNQFRQLEQMLLATASHLGVPVSLNPLGQANDDDNEAPARARDSILDQAEREGRTTLEVAQRIVEASAAKSPSAVDSVERTTRHYRTNTVLAESLKLLYGGKCQICSSTFAAQDGAPYAQVHHVKFVADGGPDISNNMLVLCPTCHAKMHHAKVRGAEQALRNREVFINGIRHAVNVHPSHASGRRGKS
jgi:5-methylcytosine-specific restriction endonuclease McrA